MKTITEDTVLTWKAAIAGVLALLTSVWGWFGWVVVLWDLLMLTDWLVGSALASKDGRWSSAKLREGAWHKAGMILTFFIALTTDRVIALTLQNIPAVALPFDYTVLLAPLVVLWYIIGELGSLAEHAVATGAPVPRWLLGVLEAGRKAVDAAGGRLSDSGQGDRENGSEGR